ncbi:MULTISPECIES: hypothetical protein [unclassified Janthinobacterium]|uniref:hypothetical protein n=1 Tax=unclassified Janthinobacterium TaxID=2610881 RepID=UPI000880FCDE|nr:MULTISPECIES: hypothetical protein [unclassified Janthinobacterium]SDA60787.1 hypothetical protein SAMN03159349_02529 [Janthinobacterium sp. 551a]SFB35046.1 hypothetical protein SAMN03159300_103534 [Janthinobacterium sp. 344]
MSSSLEVFQDLYIYVHKAERGKLAEALISHAKSPWNHVSDAPIEQQDQGEIILMERSETLGTPSARIMLWPTEVGYIVSNVVPTSLGSLTIGLYNQILQEFLMLVASPAAISIGCSATLSAATQSITDWFDAHTSHAFTRFSNLANKSTGASHPKDAERWIDFIISAHRNESKADTDLLFKWLYEVEQFPQEIAHDLASDYAFSRDLLQRYDELH